MNEIELKAYIKEHLSAKIYVDEDKYLCVSLELDGERLSYDYVDKYELYTAIEEYLF